MTDEPYGSREYEEPGADPNRWPGLVNLPKTSPVENPQARSRGTRAGQDTGPYGAREAGRDRFADPRATNRTNQDPATTLTAAQKHAQRRTGENPVKAAEAPWLAEENKPLEVRFKTSRDTVKQKALALICVGAALIGVLFGSWEAYSAKAWEDKANTLESQESGKLYEQVITAQAQSKDWANKVEKLSNDKAHVEDDAALAQAEKDSMAKTAGKVWVVTQELNACISELQTSGKGGGMCAKALQDYVATQTELNAQGPG